MTKRLSYFDQKEEYKTILHNSTPMGDNNKSVGGSESFGDFGSMLREIFEPATEARFEWDHWGTLRGQRVMEFSFHVRQERSQYSISCGTAHSASRLLIAARSRWTRLRTW